MSQPPAEQDFSPPADLLRTFLTDRDALCPQCRYNLRNLTGNRCPECGEHLVLRVNLAEPKQKLLIAGLIGLAAGAGLNGLLIVYLFIQISRNQFFYGDFLNRFTLVTGAGFLVEGGALVLWLILWRHIRRKSTLGRLFLVFACWALTLVDTVVFSFTIK